MDDVLNWMWQGSVIAIAAAAMLRIVEPSRARIRYYVLWVVLLTILLLPLVPFLSAALAADHGVTAVRGEPILEIPAGWWTSARIAISLWVLWTAVFTWRLTTAAMALRRVRRACRPLPPDVEARLSCWLAGRARGRRTRLVVSGEVSSAAVLTGAAPVIALAPRLLEHLSDEELERVVIHEWAHVQRRDDVAHLAQLAICAVVGWHPAIWWCDRQLHLEREMACDQFTATLTGSTKAYAACLAKLATLPAHPLPAIPAVAAISASGVRRRILRILAFDATAPGRARVVATMIATLMLTAASLPVGAFQIVAAVPAALSNALPRAITVHMAVAAGVPSSQEENRQVADRPGTPQRNGARESQRRSPRQQPTSAAVTPVASDAAPAAPATALDDERAALASRSLGGTVLDAGLPVVTMPSDTSASLAKAPNQGPEQSQSPWDTAVDASLAVSRGSQNAAVATAGFFNRVGRRIGGSF